METIDIKMSQKNNEYVVELYLNGTMLFCGSTRTLDAAKEMSHEFIRRL